MARRVFCFLYVLLWPLLTHSAALRTGFLPNLSQRSYLVSRYAEPVVAIRFVSYLIPVDSRLACLGSVSRWPCRVLPQKQTSHDRQISPDKNIHPVGWKISNEVELSQHNRAIYSRHNAWAGSSDEPWALLSMANLPTDSAFGACTPECG